MKILHIGGHKPVIQGLLDSQSSVGCEVSSLSPFELKQQYIDHGRILSFLDKIPPGEKSFDIVHFHQIESLYSFLNNDRAENRIEQILQAFRDTGAQLILSAYGNVGSEKDRRFISELIGRHFSLIFISSPEYAYLFHENDCCVWLSVPLAVTEIQELNTVPKTPLRIVQIQDSSDSGLSKTLNTLKERGFTFHFKACSLDKMNSLSELAEIIDQADLVIEKINSPAYGLAALLALTQGKTVLAGNKPESRANWLQLNFSPVLDTSLDNIEKRLESVLKEPICLRDLGKRSRKFIENYHNANNIGLMLLDFYKQHGS